MGSITIERKKGKPVSPLMAGTKDKKSMSKKPTGSFAYISVEQHEDGIIYIGPKLASLSHGAQYFERLDEFLEQAALQLDKTEVKGLIYRSPIVAEDFDPEYFLQASHGPASMADRMQVLSTKFLHLRAKHKPIVSILEAVSTDLRLASLLWSDHRIGTANVKIGFPTSSSGLFPGFGATSLLLQLMDPAKAIPFLYHGTILSAAEAQEWELIHQQAADVEQALDMAKRWIRKTDRADRQHRDQEQQRLAVDAVLSSLRGKSNGLVPADNLFFELVATHRQDALEENLRQENNAWASLWDAPQTLNMLRTLYCNVNHARRSAAEKVASPTSKLGILGAGIMGSGIAYEAARAGIDVVLKDVDEAAAERGKSYAKKLTDRLVDQGKINEKHQTNLLSRIYPTADVQHFAEADMIIEAVFEDVKLKAAVTKESLPFLKHGGIFASNTTALPIHTLASVSPNPDRFVGMHFFSPVDRMPLVEIIRADVTASATVDKAMKLAHQLGKVPIVVSDGPAFFTSRIFFNYLLEAVTMLLEGIPAPLIEQEAQKAGFAIGPLAVLDEISLKLMLQVYDSLPQLHSGQERCYRYLQSLVVDGRNGRKTGAGFYNYDETTGKRAIWNDPSIAQKAVYDQSGTIQKRLLHVMALDSFRCLEEGILMDVTDADIGSVLGIGFPRHTGGVFSYIDGVGIRTFVNDCRAFALYGDEWHIPERLRQLAESDFRFYDGLESNWKGQR
ncbi:3-hydroxyacyl-CoA dehydrogenase NAD-binding domain-containing protein [Sphingobacterium griseoflavum]|uniref:Fatty oxidation complex subunit alpha n=1 Tax=Sphingobacterium griseoflavum TaxID=1474952 RepID=A0ABQ3HT33_9SPHI|nr:3-hydroxyacyl-CoA dehydrogenase NAD-binding domain-containing protein [Sphingobacterium griseoflavum]GHE23332.1 fatty oxidation complex subunit alpha [Sphingobacterium griseoflavum]